MKLQGFNTHRHESNPKEKELHDKFIKDFITYKSDLLDVIVFRAQNDSQTIPNDYLSERERQICITIVQWMGLPIGQAFLRDCGFRQSRSEA